MKVCRCIVMITAFILLSSWTMTAAETLITPLPSDGTLYYVKTDTPLMTLNNLAWRPDGGRSKRDFEDPSRSTYNLTANRPVCWGLDVGSRNGINWAEVRAVLQSQCNLCIGEFELVNVVGNVLVPECYRAGSVDLVVPHVRQCFEILQNGHTAIISVLKPVDGVGLVFHDLELLPYSSCNGLMVTNQNTVTGLCASIGARPELSSTCPGSRRTKRDFEDPVMSDPLESTSWSQIKALYGN